MKDFLIQWLGYIILFVAVGYKRKEDSELKIFSADWWVVTLLVGTGVAILVHYSK